MKMQSIGAVKAHRFAGNANRRFIAWAAVAAFLLPPAVVHGAAPESHGPAVTFEDIPGTTAKRVILTARAGERLGIETGKVNEEVVVRKQMVGGLVIPPMDKQPPPPASGGFGGFGAGAAMQVPKPSSGSFGGFGAGATLPAPKPASAVVGAARTLVAVQAPQTVAPRPTPPAAAGEAWVLVTLSSAEWDRLAKDKPARLFSLGTRDRLQNELLALPSALPPLEDTKRSMLTVYYVVSGKDHGLTVNDRMRVELQLASSSDEKQKVVPYSAVYYDGKGVPWVYVNTKPLTFERQRIGVQRVVGDLAVLSDGPPVGTAVVTVGAALLYGAEIFKK